MVPVPQQLSSSCGRFDSMNDGYLKSLRLDSVQTVSLRGRVVENGYLDIVAAGRSGVGDPDLVSLLEVVAGGFHIANREPRLRVQRRVVNDLIGHGVEHGPANGTVPSSISLDIEADIQDHAVVPIFPGLLLLSDDTVVHVGRDAGQEGAEGDVIGDWRCSLESNGDALHRCLWVDLVPEVNSATDRGKYSGRKCCDSSEGFAALFQVADYQRRCELPSLLSHVSCLVPQTSLCFSCRRSVSVAQRKALGATV